MASPFLLEKATFQELDPAKDRTIGKPIPVQFNPETLKLGFTNQLNQPAGGQQPTQFVGGSTTKISPLFQIDDGRLLNQLPVWAPDAAIRKKILVDNPARVYGF